MNFNLRTTQTEIEFQISSLEETLTQFRLTTHIKFLDVDRLQNSLKEKLEDSMKRIKEQIFDLSQQISSVIPERGNCDAIELRNHTIPSIPNKHNKIVEKNNEQVEGPESTPNRR